MAEHSFIHAPTCVGVVNAQGYRTLQSSLFGGQQRNEDFIGNNTYTYRGWLALYRLGLDYSLYYSVHHSPHSHDYSLYCSLGL